jgi:hypothetical protein
VNAAPASGEEDKMKKAVWTALLALALLLVLPLPSDAGHSRGYGGKHYKAPYHGRAGYHGAWRGQRAYWGPRSSYGFRFYWGGPVVVGPPWYPFGYYASPPVIVRQQPPVYVEPQPRPDPYWYYCENPQGYYPYVKSCPGGWMQVVPQPTPPNP